MPELSSRSSRFPSALAELRRPETTAINTIEMIPRTASPAMIFKMVINMVAMVPVSVFV